MKRLLVAALVLAVFSITASVSGQPSAGPIEPLAYDRFEDLVVMPRPSSSAGPIYTKHEAPDPTRVAVVVPTPRLIVVASPEPPAVTTGGSGWHLDPNVSWYGPGFYGKRTACGLAYTKTIMGVAHKSLPCGTLITFRNPANGRTFTVPVIDRGPYVAGRQWDLSGALCTALDHCYTGPIQWKRN